MFKFHIMTTWFPESCFNKLSSTEVRRYKFCKMMLPTVGRIISSLLLVNSHFVFVFEVGSMSELYAIFRSAHHLPTEIKLKTFVSRDLIGR